MAQIHIANEEHVRLMEKIGRMEKDSEAGKKKGAEAAGGGGFHW